MSFIKKNSLIIIFLLGLILRLYFIFGSYAFDVNNHIVWAKDLHERGFLDFFNRQSSEVFAVKYPNYPSLALFIFYLFYPLPKIIFDFSWWLNTSIPFFPSNFVSLLESIDKRLFIAAMLKLPAIISDLGLAWMITLFTRKIISKKPNIVLIAASLILFNPAFIYNSSLWGQIDVIPLFFVMVSVYLLLFTRKNILSGIFFTLSILVKPTTLVFLPVYGLIFIKKFGWWESLKALFFADLIFWLSFLPFLGKINLLFPYQIYWEKIISAQSLPYVTNGAFNFWMIFIDLKKAVLDTTPFIFKFSFRVWGYLLLGLFLFVILYRLFKNKIKVELVLLGLFLSSLAFVLFLTKMHERYFLLPLPFLLLVSIKNKHYLKHFFLLSVLAFLNHYFNWASPYIYSVFNIISNPWIYKSLSVVNLLTFLYLFI